MTIVDSGNRRHHQPIKKQSTYRLGGDGAKEVIFTVEATSEDPYIQFQYSEGWITLLPRPVYYIVVTVMSLASIIGILVAIWYVFRYRKGWYKFRQFIEKYRVKADDDRSNASAQLRPVSQVSEQSTGQSAAYQMANLDTESFQNE